MDDHETREARAIKVRQLIWDLADILESDFEAIEECVGHLYSDDARDFAQVLNRIQAMALERIFI